MNGLLIWLLRNYLKFTGTGSGSLAFVASSLAIGFGHSAVLSGVGDFSQWVVRLWYCQLRFGHTIGSCSHCASRSNFFAIF